jgi:hypothetical protein
VIDLEKINGAVEEAAVALKEDPDAEIGAVVNAVMAKLGGGYADATLEHRKSAEDRLAMATQRTDAMGDHDNAALVDAVIGIGQAILSIGSDAEVFFAMFGNGDASVTAYYGGES